MSKLRSLFTWFRDVHAPTRAARAVRDVTARAIKVDDALRAPRFYVLVYTFGRSYPETYMGPFDEQSAANARLRDVFKRDKAAYPDLPKKLRGTYKIKRLTDGQLKKLIPWVHNIGYR